MAKRIFRPDDVDPQIWRRFKQHLHRRRHILSALTVSRSGRYYDVSVMQENLPIYQIPRVQ